MASIRGNAIRDLDRAIEHLIKAHKRIEWIPEAYVDIPDIKEKVETLDMAVATMIDLVEDIITDINTK